MEIINIAYKNRTIYCKLYMPEGNKNFPAIIMSHGYNGSAEDWNKECEYYARHGYIAVSYDFTGGSAGSRSEGFTSKDMTIFTEKEDLNAVLDYVQGLAKVDKKRIYLFGGSMGGLVTALVADERKADVLAIIMYYPAFCIPDNWREHFKSLEEVPEDFDFWGLTLGRDFVESIRDFDIFDNIGSFEGCVFILHGDEDSIVPLSYSDKVGSVYNSAKLWILKGEAHGFSPKGAEFAMKEVLKFMGEADCRK